MVLRDFLFWAEGCPREVASAFSSQTRGVCATMARLMPKTVTDSCWRLLGVAGRQGEPTRPVGGVLDVPLPIEPTAFLRLPVQEKKSAALSLLQVLWERATSALQLPIDAFDAARGQFVASGYDTTRRCKSPRSSPDRALTAQVLIEQEVESARVVIAFTNRRSGSSHRVRLAETLPDDLCFAQYLGDLHWIDNAFVELTGRGDSGRWSIPVPPNMV